MKTLKFNFGEALNSTQIYSGLDSTLLDSQSGTSTWNHNIMPKEERIALWSIHCTSYKYLLVLEQPSEVITPILQVGKLKLTTAWTCCLKSQLLSWEAGCKSGCLSVCASLTTIKLVYLLTNGLSNTNAFRIHTRCGFYNESFYKRKRDSNK